MSGHWYCNNCNFGPHSAEIHRSCLRCGSSRSSNSVSRGIRSNDTIHQCHEMSPYPAPVLGNEASSTPLKGRPRIVEHGYAIQQPSLLHADVHDHHSSGLASYGIEGAKVYSQTYMYICCQCNDGPKTYNMQPKCIVCDHAACPHCHYVK